MAKRIKHMGLPNSMRREVTYHFLFWVSYVVIWSLRDLVYYPDHLVRTMIINSWQSLLMAPFIFTNLYLLIPKLLFKKKYVVYSIALLFLVSATVLFASVINSIIFYHIYEFEDTASHYASWNGLLTLLSEALVLNFSSMSLYIFRAWFVNDAKLKMIEKEKLRSELDMLKQQIQPHFLFNTLNTIYMLMEKNTKEAKKTMMRFSDILSHQLYEVQDDYVSLDKEINYLKNYCEIEKKRHSDSLNLQLVISVDKPNYRIAPMLLIPFIENAFKHGKEANDYWVKICLEVTDGKLCLEVENSFMPKIESKERGGIGLKNVQRRLKLIYPHHLLEVEKNNGQHRIDLGHYRVDLELNLLENESGTRPEVI